jgi:hypothetical protein
MSGLVLYRYKGEDGHEYIGRRGVDIDKALAAGQAALEHLRVCKDVRGGKCGKTKGTALHSTAGLFNELGYDFKDEGAFVTSYVSLSGCNGGENLRDAQGVAILKCWPFSKFVLKLVGDTTDGDYRNSATVDNMIDLVKHGLLNPSGAVVAFKANNSLDGFCHSAEEAVSFPGLHVKGAKWKLLAHTVSWCSPLKPESFPRWQRAAACARLAGVIITAADDGSFAGTEDPASDESTVLYDACRFKVGFIGHAASGFGAMCARVQHEVFKKFGFYLPDFVNFVFENCDKGIFLKASDSGKRNAGYIPAGLGIIRYPAMLNLALKEAALHAEKIAALKATL